MKRATREWTRKAEADSRVALRESRVRTQPCHEAVCFHAQQCVEKYLKALLAERSAPVPRTHDLAVLWALVQPGSAHLGRRPEGLGLLTVGAVEYRYPGRRATAAASRKCVLTMKRVIALVRRELGLH